MVGDADDEVLDVEVDPRDEDDDDDDDLAAVDEIVVDDDVVCLCNRISSGVTAKSAVEGLETSLPLIWTDDTETEDEEEKRGKLVVDWLDELGSCAGQKPHAWREPSQ